MLRVILRKISNDTLSISYADELQMSSSAIVLLSENDIRPREYPITDYELFGVRKDKQSFIVLKVYETEEETENVKR